MVPLAEVLVVCVEDAPGQASTGNCLVVILQPTAAHKDKLVVLLALSGSSIAMVKMRVQA